MIMRDINIILEPFDIISIIDCKIFKKLGEHTYLNFKGRVSETEKTKRLLMNIINTEIVFKVLNEKKEELILFVGIVKNFKVIKEGDARVLELECISSTYLMDIQKKTKIFQNKNSTYEDILKKIKLEYKNSEFLMTVGDKIPIDNIIVQYDETDFEFIKRLTSHFNSDICPAYRQNGVKYFFGLPDSSKKIDMGKNYTITKEINVDLQKDKEILPFSVEQGAILLQFEDREIYEIGDFTVFKGLTYIIIDIESSLEGSELVHKYTLKEKTGLYKSKYYNKEIIGASIEAHIIDVANDKVKINVHLDGIQDYVDWFLYSTIYSSPDGTGWYFMPEVNDLVRLHFPTKKEQLAYVISSVHVDENTMQDKKTEEETSSSIPSGLIPNIPHRTEPNNKSLKSKYGKEVLFTPESLILTNNKDMLISIDDNYGITIFSGKNISIKAAANIDLTSTQQSINLTAPLSINLEQCMTAIRLLETVRFSGAKINME